LYSFHGRPWQLCHSTFNCFAVSYYTVLYCQIAFYSRCLFFLCHSVEYLSFPLNFVFFLPVGCWKNACFWIPGACFSYVIQLNILVSLSILFSFSQLVVERMLASEGIKRTEMNRDEFTKRVWQWKEKYIFLSLLVFLPSAFFVFLQPAKELPISKEGTKSNNFRLQVIRTWKIVRPLVYELCKSINVNR